jgi:hypothetical protein
MGFLKGIGSFLWHHCMLWHLPGLPLYTVHHVIDPELFTSVCTNKHHPQWCLFVHRKFGNVP